jgi:hypothetical protein
LIVIDVLKGIGAAVNFASVKSTLSENSKAPACNATMVKCTTRTVFCQQDMSRRSQVISDVKPRLVRRVKAADKVIEPRSTESEIPLRPERKRGSRAPSSKLQEGKIGLSPPEGSLIKRPGTKNSHVGMVTSQEILRQEEILRKRAKDKYHQKNKPVSYNLLIKNLKLCLITQILGEKYIS